MRVQVYAEEITGETSLVTKEVLPTGVSSLHETFYGVRMYLASPEELHDDPNDDDRSAVTLWVPWTRMGGHNFQKIRETLFGLLHQLEVAEEQDAERRIRD